MESSHRNHVHNVATGSADITSEVAPPPDHDLASLQEDL